MNTCDDGGGGEWEHRGNDVWKLIRVSVHTSPALLLNWESKQNKMIDHIGKVLCGIQVDIKVHLMTIFLFFIQHMLSKKSRTCILIDISYKKRSVDFLLGSTPSKANSRPDINEL